jgi:hypothetical protein
LRLNCIDKFFDESIFQQKQVVFLFDVAYHYVDWCDHQCFFIHVSYKILLFKTNYEHQNNVNKWYISDVFEEHSSILVVNVIFHENDLIFLDHHRIVKNIDQLMSERNLIYKSIQIINKWIITIWIVNHASSVRIVKCQNDDSGTIKHLQNRKRLAKYPFDWWGWHWLTRLTLTDGADTGWGK